MEERCIIQRRIFYSQRKNIDVVIMWISRCHGLRSFSLCNFENSTFLQSVITRAIHAITHVMIDGRVNDVALCLSDLQKRVTSEWFFVKQQRKHNIFDKKQGKLDNWIWIENRSLQKCIKYYYAVVNFISVLIRCLTNLVNVLRYFI